MNMFGSSIQTAISMQTSNILDNTNKSSINKAGDGIFTRGDYYYSMPFNKILENASYFMFSANFDI